MSFSAFVSCCFFAEVCFSAGGCFFAGSCFFAGVVFVVCIVIMSSSSKIVAFSSCCGEPSASVLFFFPFFADVAFLGLVVSISGSASSS